MFQINCQHSITGNEKAKALLADWGLQVERETVNLMARIVNSEDIIFGNDVRCKGSAKADWSNAVTKNFVISAVSMDDMFKIFINNILFCCISSHWLLFIFATC